MSNHFAGWTKKVSVRQVKEIYIVSRIMSEGPFDFDAYRDKISNEFMALCSLPDHTIDEKIDNNGRLKRFNAARWELSVVDLRCCLVWPDGDRHGRVDQAASYMTTHEGAKERVSSIPRLAHIILLLLPIIILRRDDNPSYFNIEDGVHRAAAYYLSGLREVPALVGTIPKELNHDWPWPE